MFTDREFQSLLNKMQQMVSPLEAQIQELTKQVEELSNGKETPKRSASRGKRVQQAQENA
jgi:hypothetical protein